MAQHRFTLFDADARDASPIVDRVDAASSGLTIHGAPNWSVQLRTLRGGLSDGVDVVELARGELTVSLLPTRGMGIWKAVQGGMTAGWNSPVARPVHPQHVNLAARNGLGWLDGFNELLCRCGLSFNGPPGTDAGARSPVESQLTLHGRVANLPAHRVDVVIDDAGAGSVAVIGVVDECTMFGPQLRLTSTVRLTGAAGTIEIEDRVENLGSTPAELELLYHINVGPPFLEAGAGVSLPARVIAPRDPRAAEGIDTWDRYLGPTPGYAEQAYYFDLVTDANGQTETLLHNAAGDRGFAVRFDARGLPCFTVWKCTQPEADGYVTGLEPGTNYPNFKSFEREQGRVRSLASGEVYTTHLALGLFTTQDAVTASRERIAKSQQGTSPQVHSRPAGGFSPVT